MNEKIRELIEDEENYPASVYHCHVNNFNEESKLYPKVRIVILSSFHTKSYFINKLEKPISRIIKC